MNYFSLLSRSKELIFQTTPKTMIADFVLDFLDTFSLKIKRLTVLVLDNARIHTARKIKERFQIWQQRGLFIFSLPPYSPHLNLIEPLWKELKQRWLKPENYTSADLLFYSVY